MKKEERKKNILAVGTRCCSESQQTVIWSVTEPCHVQSCTLWHCVMPNVFKLMQAGQ